MLCLVGQKVWPSFVDERDNASSVPNFCIATHIDFELLYSMRIHITAHCAKGEVSETATGNFENLRVNTVILRIDIDLDFISI